MPTHHHQTDEEATLGDDTTKELRGTIQVDEGQLQGHVDEVVRTSFEETLNAMLEAEADQLCRAQRYERSPERADTRAGHYDRKLQTQAGAVKLQVPKLRTLPFETAIIERYRRREASVEEALGRDVSGRGERAARGGHHRGAVGDAGELRDGEPAQPTDLRTDRRLAPAADHGEPSLGLPRRRPAEAELGQRGPQRLGVDRHRRGQ